MESSLKTYILEINSWTFWFNGSFRNFNGSPSDSDDHSAVKTTGLNDEPSYPQCIYVHGHFAYTEQGINIDWEFMRCGRKVWYRPAFPCTMTCVEHGQTRLKEWARSYHPQNNHGSGCFKGNINWKPVKVHNYRFNHSSLFSVCILVCA